MSLEAKLTPVQEEELAAKREEFQEILSQVHQRLTPRRHIPFRPWHDTYPRIVRMSTGWVPMQSGRLRFELCLEDVHYCSNGNLTPASEVCIRDSLGENRRVLFNCDDATGQRWAGQERIKTLQEVQGRINTLQLLEHALQKASR